jgi:hypothetical protein
MKKNDSKDSMTPSQQIDNYIKGLGDWRGKMIARLRKLILDAGPNLTEEWKWDTPVWSKLNFFKGASLADPNALFNAGLDAKATRAIDIAEGEEIDEVALKELVRTAVAYNASGSKKQ